MRFGRAGRVALCEQRGYSPRVLGEPTPLPGQGLVGGISGLFVSRLALTAAAVTLLLAAAPVPSALAQGAPARAAAAGQTLSAVRVEGNQRIEEATIRSYMLLRPGDAFDSERLDRSLKTLFATGLFADVAITRVGDGLVVKVVENPIVNRIAFEGNSKLKDETLRPELQLKPRAVFTPALAQSDRQRILDLYSRRGRFGTAVEPKIIQLDQNRVDVIFEIKDGVATLVSRIAFVGNKAFSEGKLGDVISSREEAWWRFLSSSDTYDPDRVNFDRELLRRFYLRQGYADFELVSANGELAPDRSGFFVTYTVNEGERYRVSKASITSTLRGVEPESIKGDMEIDDGDWYDGDAVERVTQELTRVVQSRGFPFAEIRPRVQRNREKSEIELVFELREGPRIFVERLEITGNVRTMDKVIRREFRLAEGDAFNAALVRRSRQRVQDLDYFTSVNITPSPGSAPDRQIVNTVIEEKATGELTLGGGYSTDIGPLLSAGLREKNLIGTGIDAALSGLVAQKQTQINLSVTDPSFLDRNLVAGFDVFQVINNLQSIAQYSERRLGTSLRLGYEFTEHLRQLWTYSLVSRNVFSVGSNASIYVQDAKGESILSSIGQTLTLDYRDSRLDPRQGYIVRLGTDFAGLGGQTRFLRTKVDAAYYYPLDRYVGSEGWGLAFQAGVGYLNNLGTKEKIIDRFFLGGDNLRGFALGGAGPHSITTGDSLGGRFIWTQTSELRFPLPVSADIGISGRAFVDVGSLSQVNALSQNGKVVPLVDNAAPRVSAGLGISWKTPFGLLNIDVAQPIIKKKFDQTQTIRFGFGTRF